MTSDHLYAVGTRLMDDAEPSGSDYKADAFLYRDGLIIALLAVAPLRRSTLAALRVGEHLLKSGDLHPRITGLSASPAASCRPSHFRPSITHRGRVSVPGEI